MSILALTAAVDWQGALVLVLVLASLAFLLLRGKAKKGKSCGSSTCGCVKKK